MIGDEQNHITRRVLSLFLFSLLALLLTPARAQEPVIPNDSAGLQDDDESLKSKVKVNVRGTVYENQSLKPMPSATVKLMDKNGKLIAGAVTKDNGQYLLPNIPSGTYNLRVSFMGYKEQSFTVTLPEKPGNFKVSDVMMREEATMMSEAIVEGQLAEMTVVDDTVMYNADAFKLPEGSMVEDLIKKLPGIEQDENGGYTWNGKQINQVLVDGKEFFGRNSDMTLKNLPAEIIDKVKAYDRKSDRARITGIDDGEERTVLDLAIKKNRKQGWMANAEGAYGTADRYRGRVNVNRFFGEQKYSVVGNAGNTEGNGLSDNQSAGFTMNYEKENKKEKKGLELNGTVNANFSQGENESSSSTQSFVNTSSAFSNGHNEGDNYNRAIEFRYKLEWKPDSMWNIQVTPSFNLRANGSSSMGENATFKSDPYEQEGITDPLAQILEIPKSQRVNHRVNRNHNSGSNTSGNLSVQINRKFQKQGRNINLNINEGIGSNKSDGDSYSQVDYYRLKAWDGGDSIYHKSQYNDTHNKDRNISANISYNEPIGDRIYLQASYQYSYQFRDNNRTVSTIFDPLNEMFGVDVDNYRSFRPMASPDTAQCNYTTRHYQNHRANLQFRMNRTQYRLTAGINVTPQISELNYTKGFKHYDVDRSVVNAAPTLNFLYRFSRQEELDIRYGSETGQPEISDMIPDTLNNANPLNIRLGNPGLKPSFTQRMSANYRRSVTELQRAITVNASFNTTQNSVSSMTQYDDETGARVTRPENINGNWNGNVSLNFNTAFRRDKHFHVNTNSQANLTNARSYVYVSKEKATRINRTRGINANQSLRFSYRNDWLEVNLNSSFRYHHSSSTNTSASNLDTYRFTYGGDTQVQAPWGMTFNFRISQESRRGYSDASMNTDELIGSFTVSQRLLPKRNLTISLRAADIFNQRAEVNRNVSSTARVDTRSRNIHSYYLFSLNYRFNRFGGRAGRGRGMDGGPQNFDRNNRDDNGNRQGGARGGNGGNGPRGGNGGNGPRGGGRF